MTKKANVSEQIISFLKSLHLDGLPKGVRVLNPYKDSIAMSLCNRFYKKYYNDHNTRRIIFGINPGRLGGGLTGIPFTDPIHLEKFCAIENPLQKKAELSSTFIYEMINVYGGPEKFYSNFYFSSISPMGFTQNGKNLNYYDHAALKKKLELFILTCLKKQLAFGIDRSVAFCLGEGDNFKFIQQLNAEHQFFAHIIPLAHPRFIMQYKRKHKSEYIQKYIEALDIIPERVAS